MASPEIEKAKLIQVVEREISSAMLVLPGCVLLSGIDTLAPGQAYIMGFNPGGDASRALENIPLGETVRRWDRRAYSAYRDEDWISKGEPQPELFGQSRHQRAVCRIVEDYLRLPLRETLSTNAIFLRSQSVMTLVRDTHYSMEDLWSVCWRVHEHMLATVRPRLILCLGNGNFGSAFHLLRRQLAPTTPIRPVSSAAGFRGGKWFETQMSWNAEAATRATVVGIPHPSRFALKDPDGFSTFCERVLSQGRPDTRTIDRSTR